MAHGTTAAAPDLEMRSDSAGCVDVHCHCLPGLDDGPESDVEAIALCRALAADGVRRVVATPHQLGRYDRRNLGPHIRDRVATLSKLLEAEGIHLNVRPGGDVRVDERIPKMLADGDVLTLADRGRHLLLELPHDSYIDPLMLIRMLARDGVQTIVSHPERQPTIVQKPKIVAPWLQEGAALQITAASLLGEFGGSAQRVGWEFVDAGWAAIVASDAHGATKRPPRMAAAYDAVEKRCGKAMAKRLFIDNPAAIWEGRAFAATTT